MVRLIHHDLTNICSLVHLVINASQWSRLVFIIAAIIISLFHESGTRAVTVLSWPRRRFEPKMATYWGMHVQGLNHSCTGKRLRNLKDTVAHCDKYIDMYMISR